MNPTANPQLAESDLIDARNSIIRINDAFRKKVVGQDELRLSLLTTMIAGGHILLESVPGLAKTLAAKTIAEATNGTFSRIQCTPDLLPSDIIGTQIYNANTASFETQIGPVHANFVLLDEVNRSSAKTQSAMLEAMQERQVSIGGVRYEMPNPFFVLATQNPIEQEGTYELPEAQLDRFLLKEIITYPSRDEELEVINYTIAGNTTTPLADGEKTTIEAVKKLQSTCKRVVVDDSIKNYIINIVQATRNPKEVIDSNLAHYVEYGVSPRGTLALMRVAQALALINNRAYVTPDDVKQLRYAALRHRIILNYEADADGVHSEAIIDAIFSKIKTP